MSTLYSACISVNKLPYLWSLSILQPVLYVWWTSWWCNDWIGASLCLKPCSMLAVWYAPRGCVMNRKNIPLGLAVWDRSKTVVLFFNKKWHHLYMSDMNMVCCCARFLLIMRWWFRLDDWNDNKMSKPEFVIECIYLGSGRQGSEIFWYVAMAVTLLLWFIKMLVSTTQSTFK